jgi:hypothetical protein
MLLLLKDDLGSREINLSRWFCGWHEYIVQGIQLGLYRILYILS